MLDLSTVIFVNNNYSFCKSDLKGQYALAAKNSISR